MDPERLEEAMLTTSTKSDSYRSRNLLAPALWLNAIIMAAMVPATPFLPLWAAVVGWIILTVVCLGTFGIYAKFALTNPQMLRSEDHALKQEALTIYGSNGKGGMDLARILAAPTMTPQNYIEHLERGDK